jgi:hypothetical protein
MNNIYHQPISITMPGHKWFALVTALQHVRLPPRRFSKKGAKAFTEAQEHIRKSLVCEKEIAD